MRGREIESDGKFLQVIEHKEDLGARELSLGTSACFTSHQLT